MKWVAVVEVGGEQKSRRTGGKGNRVWGITSIMGEDIKNQRHYAFYHYAHASSLDDPVMAAAPIFWPVGRVRVTVRVTRSVIGGDPHPRAILLTG